MPVTLNHRIDGIGRRILLLHPVGLDLTFFDALTAELAPHFQVLRVDLRGHGLTAGDANGSRPRLKDFAEDVHALLHSLHYAPTAAIGFSFGAMVAQELALNFPEDIDALVASACGCTFPEETRTALRHRGVAAERDGMASIVVPTMERWFTPNFRQQDGDRLARGRLLRNDVKSWSQTWQAISELATQSRLHAVKVPSLCLAGEHDLSTPPEVVKTVADAIPQARFQILPRAPHMLFIEQHKEVAVAIINFLADIPRKAASAKTRHRA